MRILMISVAAVAAVTGASGARAWERPRVCWNPPDAVIPGYVPCGPLTGLSAPRRTDGTYGVHPDEWFYGISVEPPGPQTGGSSPDPNAPGWGD